MTEHVMPRWVAKSEADFAVFMTRLIPKVRTSVEKRLDRTDADAAIGYGRCWKRLALLLFRLAPHAVEVSDTALRFYILDGKYRRQVFALDDGAPELIQIYLPDVLGAAVERGILDAAADGTFASTGHGGAPVAFEVINADSKEIPDFCKAMLGWGRRAVRTGIGPLAEEHQIQVIGRLCELAAENWANLMPPAGAAPAPAAATAPHK
jgi:hypothetical protein